MVSPRSSCYCFNHHALQAHYCISLMLKSLMCKFIFTQPFIIIHVHTKPLQWLLVKKKMHFFFDRWCIAWFLNVWELGMERRKTVGLWAHFKVLNNKPHPLRVSYICPPCIKSLCIIIFSGWNSYQQVQVQHQVYLMVVNTFVLNLLTTIGDRDRISTYNFNKHQTDMWWE